LAKSLHKHRAKSLCGTPNYISPEVLAKTGHSFEADIWAVGVIAYTMIFGNPPFEGQEVEDTYKNIKNCNYHFNDKSDISKEAKAFIRRILVLNPQKRPCIKELKKDVFLTMYNYP
jgi:serine/threonine protein kinase